MASEISIDRLRALAETRSPEGKVLSVFINLDPHEVPTPSARATEIRAVLDDAVRQVREHDALTAAERSALEADIERTRDHLRGEGAEEMTGGARGLAVFASGPSELFEVLTLPYAVAPEVRISDRAAVSTIARLASTEPWWLLLVDRRHARVLSGTGAGLVEHWRTEDPVAGHHDQSPSKARDQGGTSHEQHQRSAEKDVSDHLRNVAGELRKLLEDEPSSGLLLGGPTDICGQMRELLPRDLASVVEGHIDVEVWTASPNQVLAAADRTIRRLEHERDAALLSSLSDAIGMGRGAAGLGAVLEAINERRVSTIAVAQGTHARGVRCDGCGWMGISAGGTCAACGTMTDSVDDIVEEAVARGIAQGAKAHVLAPSDNGLLTEHGGIVAALRF